MVGSRQFWQCHDDSKPYLWPKSRSFRLQVSELFGLIPGWSFQLSKSSLPFRTRALKISGFWFAVSGLGVWGHWVPGVGHRAFGFTVKALQPRESCTLQVTCKFNDPEPKKSGNPKPHNGSPQRKL